LDPFGSWRKRYFVRKHGLLMNHLLSCTRFKKDVKGWVIWERWVSGVGEESDVGFTGIQPDGFVVRFRHPIQQKILWADSNTVWN
jgi:hypothetical protein